MLFGKIDYLNLLPFHVFLKAHPMSNSAKKALEFKKGTPSKLCRELYFRRIDAAIISSIESRRNKYYKLDFGIVAKNEVTSVLARKNSPRKLDKASMSSNMLSKILGVEGEIIIGDNALKCYLKEGKDNFHDLALIWHEKTNLPFVFGLFSGVKNKKFYEKLVKKFLKSRVKIPRYILNEHAKKRGISPQNILWYLEFISYEINHKERLALKKFINEARKLNFNPN